MAEPYLWSYSRHSPQFMELEGSLQHSKQPATCPSLKPDQSNPRHLILFIKNNFNIIPHPPYLFPSGYSIKTQYPFIPCNPPPPRSPEQYLVALHSTTLLIMLLSPFSLSIKFSNTGLHLMRQTKFHTHIKEQENLPFCLQ